MCGADGGADMRGAGADIRGAGGGVYVRGAGMVIRGGGGVIRGADGVIRCGAGIPGRVPTCGGTVRKTGLVGAMVGGLTPDGDPPGAVRTGGATRTASLPPFPAKP
jgi:hypothetical protein